MMRVGLVLAVAAALAGCSLGFGTPYPGAASRYREFYRCSRVAGSWCYGAHRDSETTGGGSHGAVAGMRMGDERGDLGADRAGGVAFDVRGEYSYGVTRWAALGGFAGVQLTVGDVDGTDTDFSARRVPVGAQLTLVPTPPLVVRGGGFVAPGTIRVGDAPASSITTRGWFAGAGMSIPFPGLHLVLTFEWQHHTTPDVMTASGAVTYDADTYLFGYWLVL